MTPFLVFEVYGHLSSWGEVAVGEVRSTSNRPTRSALLGLLAACRGVRREDDQELRKLDDGLGFGVKILSLGRQCRDYHTIQSPSRNDAPWATTRRHELCGSHSSRLNTLISTRSYREESHYIVAAWHKTDLLQPSLEELGSALRFPYFVPYLGRKSCPAARPFGPRIIPAESLRSALDSFSDRPTTSQGASTAVGYAWDAIAEHGMTESVVAVQRYDQPAGTRKSWQFGERTEFMCLVESNGNVL